MAANPLLRPRRAAHAPLLVLAVGYLVPLVWLVMSALQPREQVGKIPPEWLPRKHVLAVDGGTVQVTPPVPIDSRKLVVIPERGPRQGHRLLVDPARFSAGMVTLSVQEDDRTVTRRFRAVVERDVPAGYVYAKEWRLSKYAPGTPREFYVPAERVSVVVEPVLGNFPEAVRALTAGERQKQLPLGELLASSEMPWTPEDEHGRTVTFLSYLANTLVVALLAVLGTTLSSALVAYGLSRIEWKGRTALFAVTLATMMIPFPVLMVPLYSLFRGLGWIGTLRPLWVPACFGGAFNIFLLRQFFMTIPRELGEAARIDGCSEFRIFWRVILPLSKPALAVVALFHFLFVYNDFLGPLIFLTRPDTFTMALGLQQYQSQHGGSEWHLLMAASTILVLPIIVLFFFAQKTFIQGISTTGLKG
jgi:multiple sugar transport system permease protein